MEKPREWLFSLRVNAPRWFKRRHDERLVRDRWVPAWLVGTAVILVVALAVLLWLGPVWIDDVQLHGLTPDQRITAIDAARGRIIQFGAGALALGALIFTGLNFRLSREGHVTDRYTKAIEQLGSEHIDVRLGAIYALERIMIDSARDHATIVEVLAAFVREHSDDQRTGADSTALGAGSEDSSKNKSPVPPPTDVLAALSVLSRRPIGREERGGLNLRGAKLTLAIMKNADLRKADMTGADLVGADLTGADLTGAFLPFADLSAATLVRTDLTKASMALTNLCGARLVNAYLAFTNLKEANLRSADFREATLTYVVLEGTDLTEANFKNAKLNEVILADAKLSPNQLAEATIRKTDLSLINGIDGDTHESETS